MNNNKDLILIHSSHCLSCKYLSPLNQRFFRKCHYSKGNESCPAKYMTLVLGNNVEALSNALMEATVNKDYNEIAEINKQLSKLDPAVSEHIQVLAEAKKVTVHGKEKI